MPADADAATPALEVDGLGYGFAGGFVLEDVSFAVPTGAFTVLLGPNGAGKTTLIALITRLYDPLRGRVRISGHDVRSETAKALAGIGVVFQQPTLDLDLTVTQNLFYHAALHGLAGREADRRVAGELDRLGMFKLRGERIRHLSGGQRRRVEIARALLHRPRLILLDEPTVGLDVPSRQNIVQHAHALCADGGIAVLWATHLIDEVKESDRVVVLHEGRLRAEGSRDEVLARAGADTIADAFDALTGDQP